MVRGICELPRNFPEILSPHRPCELRRLELQLQCKLNLTLRDYGGRDNGRSSRTVRDERVRLRENRMVEGVKEFCAKLESNPFVDAEDFSGRKVHAFLPRTLQNVFPGIAEVSYRNRKVVYVKPQTWAGMRNMAAADSIGPQQPLRPCVGRIASSYLRGERKARTEGDDASEVPSTERQVHWATVV